MVEEKEERRSKGRDMWRMGEKGNVRDPWAAVPQIFESRLRHWLLARQAIELLLM